MAPALPRQDTRHLPRRREESNARSIVKRVLSGGMESTLFTNSDFVVDFDWTANSATIFSEAP